MGAFDFTKAITAAISGAETISSKLDAKANIVTREFPRAVASSGWRLLSVADNLDFTQQVMIVVGVALWSMQDLEALDLLADRSAMKKLPTVIFSVDEFANLEKFSSVMPGVGLFITTPVLAVYQQGKLVHNFQGTAVNDWIAGL